MTGFLNVDLLRAHAAPRDRWPDWGRATLARPHLVAQWERASDGHLVCRWRIDDRTDAEPLASVRPFPDKDAELIALAHDEGWLVTPAEVARGALRPWQQAVFWGLRVYIAVMLVGMAIGSAKVAAG